ncbi:MAG: hypothetical protein KJ043_12160 [Anaerolineae bacterium]|nr:hypothetical protein [Anaerolineae bacterium]
MQNPTPIVVAQNNTGTGGLIAPVTTPPQAVEPVTDENNNSPLVPLLLIAVGLQVVIIGIAGLEFMSRRRRRA